MALPTDRNAREYNKFVANDSGDTTVRTLSTVADSSGNEVGVTDGKLDVNAEVSVSDVTIETALARATHTSPKDFTATYTSSTTLTLSSLPFTITDSSQIAYIIVIPSGGSNSYYLINGSGGVTLTVSSNVITVDGADTSLASGDVYQVGIVDQTKAYDSSTNSLQNSTLNPVYNKYTDAEDLISSAQDFGTAMTDLGSEIDAQGYNKVRFFVTQDVNGGTDLRYKILGKHESAGTDEYALDSNIVTITAPNTWEGGSGSAFFEMDNDEDDKFVITVDTNNSIPYLQLQVGSGSANTGSGTAQVDACTVIKGY